MLCAITVLILLSHGPTYEDRLIANPNLEREVRRAMPLYMGNWQFVVGDDGKAVFSKGSELNRFSTDSTKSKIGEVLVYRKIAGKDWCLTMSQSAHATAAGPNQKAYSEYLVAGRGWSEASVVYSTASGGYIAKIDMDQRGGRPNQVTLLGYLMHPVRDIADAHVLWGFRTNESKRYLLLKRTVNGGGNSQDPEMLPEGLSPLAYDPVTRRVVALQGTENVAIYHPRSRSKRLLPAPAKSGRYWMSHGEVYFQGDGDMYVAQGRSWNSASSDLYLGKSANDKYWLLRRENKLYLRQF